MASRLRAAQWTGIAVALALIAAACGGSSDDDAPTRGATSSATPAASATNTARTDEAFPIGIAGLIPRNWPAASAEDWAIFIQDVPVFGGLVGAFTNWADEGREGKVPNVVDTVFSRAKAGDITPVVMLGVTRDLGSGVVVSTVDWDNAEQRQHFLDTVRTVARRYKPAYLGIGSEVNRLWLSDRDAFDGFVAAYREAYAIAKGVSPETRVFTGFQLEMMRGEAALAGGADEREPHWELIDQFAGVLDLAGFSSYPALDFANPAAIPATYYDDAIAHAPVPVAFTEIGWPAAPIGDDAEIGGTEAEQAEFVERFFELVDGRNVAFALWAFPHDPGVGVPVAFQNMGLRKTDGTKRAAEAAWASRAP